MSSPTPSFAGLRVASLESRQADDMARLIQRFGGEPFVSPSMREVPLADDAAAVEFAHQLITGRFDLVVFLTGVGFRHLLTAVERHVDRERFLNALRDMPLLARGPKPAAALKEVGITPAHRVPEPNTWRDLLKYLDTARVPLAGAHVALQEYGQSNPSLIAGLEARGAHVYPVRIYEWQLPEDTAPLANNLRAIIAGERDVLLITSAQQVANLLRLARECDLERPLRQALSQLVVASIGPTSSEFLSDADIAVDLEPEHPKMGPLVMLAAEHSAAVLARKRAPRIVAAELGSAKELSTPRDRTAPWYNSPFLQACRGEPTTYTPVWLMRQAGRYMQEYREVRAKTTFLELCRNPQLCSEVMCVAVERLGVDAAIIFSDLLPMLQPMGLDLEFAQNEGPVIHNPLREAADLARFYELEDLGSVQFVLDTVSQTRRDLPAHLPLIGFAGAPFTLASYAIEGGASRNYLHTKRLMFTDAGAWRTLMERLARSVARYLNGQIAAGAQCVQIFDSWVGCLGVDQYRRFVLPYMQQLFSLLTPGVPVINFGTGNPALLPLYAEAGGDVIGIDWRVRLDDAWRSVGHQRGVQGNLDPAVLLSDRETIRAHVLELLRQAGGRAGHIFNLGHGVHQQTPVENAVALVELVHELSARPRAS
jgi:uroporphyrinogen decarboxylase